MNEDLAMNSAFNKLRSIDDLDEVIYAQEYDNSINTVIGFLVILVVQMRRLYLVRIPLWNVSLWTDRSIFKCIFPK